MPHTLLLADDSVTIQRVIELTFADEDVNVVAVSDGDQAIARLDAAPPDIVLADVGMPGKNGYEVAQYIKQSPKLSHIPVVLLTGAFEPVDQARAAEAGCDGVLAKPFEPQLVIGRVKELLGQQKPVLSPPSGLDAALAPPPAPAESWSPPLPDQPLQTPEAAPPATGDLANYFDRLDAAFANLSAPAGAAPPEAMAPVLDSAEPPSAAPVPDEIDWFAGTVPASDAPSSIADQIEAAAPVSAEAPDLPLSYASPLSAFEAAPALIATEAPAAADVSGDAEAEAFEARMAPAALEAPTAAVAYVAVEASEARVAPDPRVAPAALEATEVPASTIAALPQKPVALPPLAAAFAALLAAERGETPSNVSWPSPPPQPQPTDAFVDQVTRRVLDGLAPRIEASVRSAVGDLVSELAERLIREEIERIKAAIK